jgi:zinc transporter 1
MFWLTAFFFLVEIVVGYVTNSMALVADSFHMLSDVAALVVAFLSVKVSNYSYYFPKCNMQKFNKTFKCLLSQFLINKSIIQMFNSKTLVITGLKLVVLVLSDNTFV